MLFKVIKIKKAKYWKMPLIQTSLNDFECWEGWPWGKAESQVWRWDLGEVTVANVTLCITQTMWVATDGARAQ